MTLSKAIGYGVLVQVVTLLVLYYLGTASWLTPLLYALLLCLGLILGSFVAARLSPRRPRTAALVVPLPVLFYIILSNTIQGSLSTRSLLQLAAIFVGSALIAIVLDSWQQKQVARR